MNIWVPRTKIIENTREEIILPSHRVSGAYKLVGRLDDGRTRIISDWFPNIVTNLGLDKWGTGQPVVQCSVGSGTTAPAATDIALVTWVADATTNSSVVYAKKTTSPYYGYGTATFTFAPPGSNKTLAEVGVGWGSGGTNLFSRARIKASGGADTTVTWLAAETLYVYYEARMYPWETDATYTNIAISGTNYSGTVRLMRASDATAGVFWNNAQSMTAPNGVPGSVSVSAYSGAIGTITATEPAGTKAPRTSSLEDPYTAGTYYRTGNAVWGPNDANMTIQSFGLTPTVHPYQMSINPSAGGTGIVKSSGWTLSLNWQSPQWARYP